MSPAVAALSGALAVAALAIGVVRPVAVAPARRPRSLVVERESFAPVVPCPSWFARAATAAGLDGEPAQWFTVVVVGVIVLAGGVTVVGGPGLAALVGAGAAGGVVVALRAAAGRGEARLVAGIPDTLDALARSTRAGSSVVQALAGLDRADGSTSDQLFASIARRVVSGESFEAAVAHLAARHSHPSVRLALAALVVSHETGAPPAKAVEGVAATLRDGAALAAEARAHATQARASAWVLVVAPAAFSLFTIATDPRVGDFLLRSPLGWLCLILGVGLDLLGAWWMRSIMAAVR